MPPHSYTVTVNKEDFNETFTENSCGQSIFRLKQHIELTDTSSPNAFLHEIYNFETVGMKTFLSANNRQSSYSTH